MKKIFLGAVFMFVAFGLFTPRVSQAMSPVPYVGTNSSSSLSTSNSIADLQAQISSLMTQLNALQTLQNQVVQKPTYPVLVSAGMTIQSPNGGEYWKKPAAGSIVYPVSVNMGNFMPPADALYGASLISDKGTTIVVVKPCYGSNTPQNSDCRDLWGKGMGVPVFSDIPAGNYKLDVMAISNGKVIAEDQSDNYFTIGSNDSVNIQIPTLSTNTYDCGPGAMFSSKTGMKCNAGENVSTNTGDKMMYVISPNGGEVWRKGGTYNISWKSQNIPTVRISLFNASQPIPFASMGLPATQAITNTGNYKWTIPQALPDSKEYRISVSDGSVDGGVPPGSFDSSDNMFSLVSFGGTSGTVNADVTRDGRVNVDDLLYVINHWGKCPAHIPEDLDTCRADINTDFTVDALDLGLVTANWTKTPTPTSPTVTPSSHINITSPQSGAVLKVGSPFTVTWTGGNPGDQFILGVRSADGSWGFPGESIPVSKGSYTWPQQPESHYPFVVYTPGTYTMKFFKPDDTLTISDNVVLSDEIKFTVVNSGVNSFSTSY